MPSPPAALLAVGAPRPAAKRQRTGPYTGVPRVRVLREEADEAAVQLLVEGGEQERQHRLRDPGAGGQRDRERLQALQLEQLANEDVEGRPVDQLVPCQESQRAA